MIADITDRRIVITGGGGGVGSAVAGELCRLGAVVVVCGRTIDTLNATVAAIDAELGPGRAGAVRCDVRDADSVAAMIDSVIYRVGGIDGLVNNASGLFPAKAETISANGFQAVTATVLQGTWNCTTELARRWLAVGQPGAVVNMLTPYAWTGAPLIAHTAAAKGGVLNLTRTLGAEWAPHGIRVNAIAPGFMDVGGTQALIPDAASRARLLATIPAGRLLRTEETARAIGYLLSDDAAYVTGTCLTIDGGQSLSRGIAAFRDLGPPGETERTAAGGPERL
jgi:NAD(P)-dependent dehydrogenase (short-subunit alcohol dehydrogenase family)